MKLIFVFAVVLSEIVLINLFKVVEIIGAFGIDTFVDNKVFASFLGDKGMGAVWASQLYGGEAAFVWGESGRADLAQKLSFGAIIPV